MTMDETDSYDIVQEVFLRFIKYADSYIHGNLKGYLLIIARNLCRDYFRKREKEKRKEIRHRENPKKGMRTTCGRNRQAPRPTHGSPT